jgi:hypothetical protein
MSVLLPNFPVVSKHKNKTFLRIKPILFVLIYPALSMALRHPVFNCGEPMAQPTIIGNNLLLCCAYNGRNKTFHRFFKTPWTGGISEVMTAGNAIDQSFVYLREPM